LNAVSIKAAASSDMSTGFVDPPFPVVAERPANGSSSSSSPLSAASEAVFLLLLGGG